MPRFSPFRGFLYDRELVPRLEDVTSPPYDVIDETERVDLLSRHEWNAAHLDVGEPDDLGDQYDAACRRFESWAARGILRRDPEPRLYLYRQGFKDEEGRARQTSGVIGAVTLEEPGHGILPHERTMPKPLGDRLDLLRACQVNISPIWMLSPAEGLSAMLEPEGPPRAAFTDPHGVHHRLWDISSSARIDGIAELVGSAPLVIADGHHRYQTALAYEREAGNQVPGANALMAFVVELSPDQLQVHPIHRILRRSLAVAPSGTAVEGDLAALSRGKHAIVVGTAPGRGFLLDPPAAGSSPSAQLHEEVMPRLGVDAADLEYEATEARVARAATDGATVFYLPPVEIDDIAAMARTNGLFPEKTTYFAPKPATGLVFRSLRES